MYKSFRKSPFWFRTLNKGWKSTYPFGTKIKLDKDNLIRSARRMTGLHDLGKDFSDEPLERLLRSINEEANLHPVGRFITKQRFASLVAIRLRAEHFFRRHPEILEQQLYPAWIIIGLQRTGTTKLHRILASDPDHRVIPSWEVINPVPFDLQYDPHKLSQQSEAHDPKTEAKKRIAVADTSVKALKLMSPGFFAIHPIEVHEPEEDILLLDISFLSTTPEAMMHVPSYSHWLESTDQSAAYAYYVKMLKLMQWIRPARRWVLKTPHHLEFPDLIEKHFNEVHFIWPHRSLYESVPSFLSMVTYNRMIFSDDADVSTIGKHWVRKTGYMLDKALDYRLKGNNGERFTDIYYKDLITNSEAELSKIYHLNGGLDPELLQRFEQHEKEHPHKKYGSHNYSLADFNLTESDIDDCTRRYQKFMNEHYGK